MLVPGLLALFLILISGVVIGSFLSWQGGLNGRQRREFVVAVIWQAVMLGLLAFVLWPQTPAGLAGREEVAEDFMTLFSAGESEAALDMLINTSDENFAEIGRVFSNPDNWPVEWELEEPYPTHNFFGKAIFPDGVELEVMLGLTWEWPRARWGVRTVAFGNGPSDSGVRNWLATEFVPFSWFSQAVMIISLACIGFSIRLVWRINRGVSQEVRFV